MKTQEEVRLEIAKLSNVKQLSESGVVVRMITLIALEWILDKCPVSPSDRLVETEEETTELIEGGNNGTEISDE